MEVLSAALCGTSGTGEAYGGGAGRKNMMKSTGKMVKRTKQDAELHMKERKFRFLLVTEKGFL